MSAEVSVIIPCYNQAQYLPDALNSVLAQTFAGWEGIIIDDGSTDNTEEVALPFCKKDERIQYFKVENGGPSKARNYGIERAQTKYILPLDGDDKISANYVEECLSILNSSDNIKLVYGAGEKFGLINEPWKFKKYTRETLLFSNCIHSCGMYRKTDWATIGGYDTNMTEGLEDWEFWISLLDENAEVRMVDNITLYWRIKQVSRTTLLNTGGKTARMYRYVYNKHADLYAGYFSDPLQLYINYSSVKHIADFASEYPFKFFLSRLFKKRRRQ